MSTEDQRLAAKWKEFISSLPPDELQKLREANIDPSNPMEENLPMFYRRVQTDEGIKEVDSYFEKITNKRLMQEWSESTRGDEDNDPLAIFAIAIAARVIDAFDCSRDKRVRMHADCFRIAIGYNNHQNLDSVAAKYKTKRQNIHWHVKTIQKRIGL